jgi:hypothetical protein
MKTFYTYIWWRTDGIEPVPFYVGKGTGIRFKRYHSLHFQRILNKHKFLGIKPKVTFVFEDRDESKALEQEIFWIKKFGRKDLGTGSLINLTDGGEGGSGYLHTEETKQKLSDIGKGQIPWNKGKEASPEAVKHQSESHMGKKNPHIGVKKTEETKAKISQSLVGNTRACGHYTSKAIWKITFPDGHGEVIDTLNGFCETNNLSRGKMKLVAKGTYLQHKGFKCEKVINVA